MYGLERGTSVAASPVMKSDQTAVRLWASTEATGLLPAWNGVSYVYVSPVRTMNPSQPGKAANVSSTSTWERREEGGAGGVEIEIEIEIEIER